MQGNPENEIQSIVKIIPEKKYPFSITNVSARNGKMLTHTLKNIENKSENGYLLTVKNLKKTSGTYFDLITLTTDSDIQPEIKINVMANLKIPDKEKADKKENTKNNAAANNFLELIKKHQQQKATETKSTSGQQTTDPERAEELKKKFEELIKQAQKKNQTKEKEPAQSTTPRLKTEGLAR
ncbi:MAG: hypothetical protein U9P10_05470 [Thermodesulfobacteriota bacterium]|nr:hypothetical protein [Thermodesulfobacteriota bacterium]